MTREEKIARATELRDQGLKYREVADRMGLPSKEAAWKLVNHEVVRAENLARNTAKREHENRNRAACPSCGQPMCAGSGSRSHRPDSCTECLRKKQKADRHKRAERIVDLWNSGASLEEIAVALDSTANSIGTSLAHLRKEGFDLPYRRAGYRAKAAA